MSGRERDRIWQVGGRSVRGASHRRGDRPNQDALHWLPAGGQGQEVAMAIADGHGSPRYWRSQVGSKLAVRTTTHLLWQVARPGLATHSLPTDRQSALHRLPHLLAESWRDQVRAHVARHPFTPLEGKQWAAHSGDNAGHDMAHNPWLAYGTTVVAALLTGTYLLFLQLGDGDILTVSWDGVVDRPALPQDERLFANETTSLCSDQAWRDVRIHIQPRIPAEPALVLLATDGYANSFVDEGGFRAVGRDLQELIRETGPEAVNRRLVGWLHATSAAGSGDDITVALAARI